MLDNNLIFSMEYIFFLMMAFKLVAASLGVVLLRHPIYAVLCLIVAFLDTSVIFLLLGAEFLAFILAIVYVGAVAVLFLFMVMMFDVSLTSIKERIGRFGFFATGLFLFFTLEIMCVALAWTHHQNALDVVQYVTTRQVTNTQALGHILYTDFVLAFQIGGIILLLAMVGAITLTLSDKITIKRQDHRQQLNRKAKDTLRLVKVPFRKGMDS